MNVACAGELTVHAGVREIFTQPLSRDVVGVRRGCWGHDRDALGLVGCRACGCFVELGSGGVG